MNNQLLIAVLIILMAASILDWKEKMLPVWFLAGATVISVIVLSGMKSVSFLYAVSGIVPGGLIWFTAVISREKIGKGDAILTMIIGMYLGFWQCAGLLFAGIALVMFIGGGYLLVRRKSIQTELPLCPFLLMAFIGGWVLPVWMGR